MNLWRKDSTTHPALKHAVTQEETRTEKGACSSKTATVAAAVQTVSDKLAMMEHTAHVVPRALIGLEVVTIKTKG